MRLVHHVGGKHLCGDGPDVPRVVDDARQDHEWIAGTKCECRPVVELQRYIAPHDVPDFGATWMTVPAGGDTLGNFGKGLHYLPSGIGDGKRCNSVRLNVAGAADWVDSGSVAI